uniref:Transporter n=1 Tax=Takifugu rubripes TaxID=31033 RepID=A0A674NIZ6_TAKRU
MERREREDQSSVGARGQWASKTEYILVIAGNVVGLGNVWRFPYLCYRYGGGAFLIPYCLLAVVFGIPLFLLETSLGQFTQEGFVTCWRKVCPLAQGIGYAYLMLKLYDFCYIVVQVWALFYLVFSFKSQLPWANCNNGWNTVSFTCLTHTFLQSESNQESRDHQRRMLGMSGGIEHLGSVRWELVLCLLVCWVFCFFSIWKGVRSSGKVAYFTATFPYVMLLILLIRGLTLPGAFNGIYFYLYPSIEDLTNLKIWIEAGSQIFFSYSLVTGNLIVLSSYNKYNNNCYRDCFFLCLLNSCTSFLAGFVVFSVLGFMAQQQGVTVDAVADSGPGLAFITYPQAAALMPLPQFWTVCFFLMLLLLAVDTHVIVESFITTVSDLFPKVLHAPIRHDFLFQLMLVTEGGIYIFQLIDNYSASRFYDYFMAPCECLVISWIFGVDRFMEIIKDMTGAKPFIIFKLLWKYIIPLVSLISLILFIVNFKHLKINDWYVYPDWAYALGWMMTISTVIMVPLWAVIQMCWTAGTFRERLSVLCRPDEDPVRLKRATGDEGTDVALTADVTL